MSYNGSYKKNPGSLRRDFVDGGGTLVDYDATHEATISGKNCCEIAELCINDKASSYSKTDLGDYMEENHGIEVSHAIFDFSSAVVSSGTFPHLNDWLTDNPIS